MRYIHILFMCVLFGQNINFDNMSSNEGSTGSIGTVTINDEVYNQLSLRPEIPFGKLGVGLDIYLYFNDDGMYWKSWDFSSGAAAYRTIIDKIYYLRWGKPGDDLYFRAGALESVTLGQGILVNNYSNIMEYPEVRQVGLDFQAKFSDFGFEFIHSNFKVISPGIMALRGSYKYYGISYVLDLDQYAGLKDSDGDSYPDNYDDYPYDDDKNNTAWEIYLENPSVWNALCTDESNCNMEDILSNYLGNTYNAYDPETADRDPISAIAFDFSYPFSNKFTLYSQFAQLMGEVDMWTGTEINTEKLGWGAVPIGIKAKLGLVDLRAELRTNSRRFMFNYWDRAYDVNRVTISANSEPMTKESLLYQYGKLSGFYSQATTSIMDIFTFGFGYQSMSGEKWDDDLKIYVDDESNQTLLSTIKMNPSIVPKIGKAEAFYQQSNVPNPFKFKPDINTIWGYDLGVEFSSDVMLIYKVRTNYIVDLDVPGEFVPQKSVQIETQFNF